jgi:hypothetical protein
MNYGAMMISRGKPENLGEKKLLQRSVKSSGIYTKASQ